MQALLLFTWGAEITTGAKLEYESHYYPEDLTEPTRNNDQILRIEPTLNVKYNRRSRMVFTPHLRSNVSTDETPEQYFLNIKEAYWEIKATPNLRLRPGANIHSWGIMDGYSPLDVVNGRILYNPISSEKRGAASLVDLLYEKGSWQFQALYIPYNSRTVLPSTDSRWLPRNIILNVDPSLPQVYLPEVLRYHYLGVEGKNEALQNNFGFKISKRMSDWDFNAVFFEGASLNPQIRLNVTGVALNPPFPPNSFRADPDVGLTPVFYRQQTSGANAVWAPSDLIIRLETAYVKSRNKDPLIPQWIWQSALGVEKPISIGSTSLVLLAQTYYAENKDPEENIMSSSNRLFDRAAVVGGRWDFQENRILLMSYLYNYKNQSSLLHLGYDMKLTEKVKLGISGDLVSGEKDTLLGTYTENDRVIGTLTYFW